MSDVAPIPLIPRTVLSEIFRGNRQAIVMFDELQRYIAKVLPDASNGALAVAQQAETDAAAAEATAIAAGTTADAALLTANTIAAAEFAVTAPSGVLANERVLDGSPGVTIDLGTPAVVAILVNALAILNAAAIDFTQPVDVQNSLRCDSLRIDQTPAASVATVTHSVPIDLDGTTYYLLLSNVP